MVRKKLFNPKEFNNIKDIIYNSAKEFGNKTAFTLKDKEEGKTTYVDISYNQFLDDINALGTAFYSIGLKEKRVAVIGKNRYEWILTHLSNLLGSMVSVPLDKDLQLEELESSLIRSKAEAIIFDKKLLDLIEEIKKRNNTSIKEYIAMDKIEGYTNIPDLLKKGKEIIKKGNKEYIDNKIDNNEMNILLFTSGTTSKSKAVMLSQRNIASNIYALQCVEDIRSTDTNIAFLPFHHIFGSSCIVWTLACGLRNVFPDGLRYIKQNLNEYKVTVFVGVPILIESIHKAIMREVEKQGKTKLINFALRLSSFLMKLHIDVRRKLFKQILDQLGGELRFVVSGGAPADAKIAKQFNDMGIKTVQGYGLTETSPVIAGEDYLNMKPGTVGLPMINDTIEIVNPDENGIGEIRVKGPNIMIGYYEMPEETERVLKDGWFYTGDLGYLDKDGYLTITGRNKNMIVLKNGKKVFPEELESLVNRIELVEECMVFGMPDEEDKNDITLSVKVVYSKEIAEEKYAGKTEEELRKIIWEQIKKVNTTFPKYKHIKNMILTSEELIKTTTKKVKRHEEMKKIIGTRI
ncbi:MAG: AMP-binding protein [Clostridia bacterium]|nr:AMP-binding protein [Clostridia bacterium]